MSLVPVTPHPGCEFCKQNHNRPDLSQWKCPYCGLEFRQEGLITSVAQYNAMREHLIAIIEEGYEVHLNQQILRHDGEAKDGSNVYVIIDTRKSPVLMKEFKTAVEAVEEWLNT